MSAGVLSQAVAATEDDGTDLDSPDPIDPTPPGGGATVRKGDNDTFESRGKEISLGTSVEMYPPEWSESLNRFEVDFTFVGNAVTMNSGKVEPDDILRQKLNIDYDTGVGTFYSLDDEQWYAATSTNPDDYDYEGDEIVSGITGLALSYLNPVIGASFTASQVLGKFASYISSQSCSGICEMWDPTLSQDLIGVYRLYRRQVPEYTTETVTFENVAFGREERVAITSLEIEYSVAVDANKNDLVTVTKDNMANYNLSPISKQKVVDGKEVKIDPSASATIRAPTEPMETRREEIINGFY